MGLKQPRNHRQEDDLVPFLNFEAVMYCLFNIAQNMTRFTVILLLFQAHEFKQGFMQATL